MKNILLLPACCFFFVLSGMAGCGKPSSMQKPVAISNESAVEKPAEKPEAGAAVIAKKEPATTPEKPPTEKAAKKPEAGAAVIAKKEPAATPEKPPTEKAAKKPEASKATLEKKESIAAPDKAQLEQAARAIAEASRRETKKKNAPKPKIIMAPDLPVVEVTVKERTYLEYNTDIGGDEQGAVITRYPKHSNNSHILRDKTTGFEAVYRYRSKPGYIGKDSVWLQYTDHQPGSGPDDPGTITKTLQVINITVEKK